MKNYVFLGSTSELPGVALTHYGQVFQMDEATANRLICGHPQALILPEEDFLKLPDISDKQAAWKAMAAYRETVMHTEKE